MEDINLFDPVFTMTLLHFHDEDSLRGMTTIYCVLKSDVSMPSIHERIAFFGDLLSMQNEGIVVTVDSICKASVDGETISQCFRGVLFEW